MFGFGFQELIIILAIVILVFGATRLPELGRGFGQAIKNFKKSMSEPEEIDVTHQRRADANARSDQDKSSAKS